MRKHKRNVTIVTLIIILGIAGALMYLGSPKNNVVEDINITLEDLEKDLGL